MSTPSDPRAYPPVPLPRPQHPSAMTAMGLGIFGLVGAFTCLFPLLAAPFAWAVGRGALREIDAEPQRWSGRDLASAGYVMGIVGTVLLVIVLLALVGVGLFLVQVD